MLFTSGLSWANKIKRKKLDKLASKGFKNNSNDHLVAPSVK